MQFDRRKLLLTVGLGIVWIACVACGMGFVLSYDGTAGPIGAVPQQWPATSKIECAADRFTLVMLAHPRCPCSRASVGELAQIMAGAQGKANAYVLFFKPKDAAADWDETDLRRSAAAIPGVTVLSDVDGAEAERFGGETSGHTLLFARDGKLLFSGGITDSRGHAGGNNGESAIVALVENQRPEVNKTLVFGCRISARAETGEGALCSK